MVRRPQAVIMIVFGIVLLAMLDLAPNDATGLFALGFSMPVIPEKNMFSRFLYTETIFKLSLSKQWNEGDRDRLGMVDESRPKSLGIDLGKDYSMALNSTDREILRSQVKDMIDQRISVGILDLQKLHDKWERQVEQDLVPLEQAMTLNGIQESKRFGTRLDSIVGTFWNQTASSRKKTHDLFRLDEMERIKKQKEEENRKAKRKQNIDGSFQKQSWKKTNDAWDDWDKDDW